MCIACVLPGLHPQQLAALQAAQQHQLQQRQLSYPPAAALQGAAPQGRGIHGQGATQRPLSPQQQQQLLAAGLQAKQQQGIHISLDLRTPGSLTGAALW